MKRGWLLLIGAFLVLGVASYATARYLSRGPVYPKPCPGMAMLQDYLELTPAQHEALAGIDTAFGKERPALRQELWQARDELLRVLREPDSTRTNVVAAVKRFSAAQQALQMDTVEYVFELRRHLTPAQREKMIGVMGQGMCALTCGPGMGKGCAGQGRGACGFSGERGMRGRP